MKRSVKVLGASVVATVLTFGAAEQAQAATIFTQSWGSGSYHASKDFIAGSGNINLGGRGGAGGSARYFYVQLVTTSGSNKVHSTYSWPTDGGSHSDSRNTSVPGGTSYYLRWYGQDGSLNNGYTAPSATAFATR